MMSLVDIIFPKRCVGCGRIGRYICARCRSQIIPIAPNECICPVCEKPAIAGATHPRCRTRYGLDGLTSFFYYKDVVRRAIQSLKYRFVRDLASEFMDLVPLSAYEIRSLADSPDALCIPVPLHPSRLRHRGFNQSEALGGVLAKRLRIKMNTRILSRPVATSPQVSMKEKSRRLTNVRGVFALQRPAVPQAGRKTVLLFDDVFTTGSTLREAAGILKRGGFGQVWGVTMAR